MVDEKDWKEIALPALLYIDECERSGSRTSTQQVKEHLGLDAALVDRELQNLVEDFFITGVDGSSFVAPFALSEVRLLPNARRALRHWPRTFDAAEFLASIDEAIEAANGEDRTKLERFRDAAAGVGNSVLSGLISGAASAAASGVI